MNRSLVSVFLGLAFVVTGAAASGAAVTVPTSQCNADPGIDASNDPVHCHYEHPLPVPPWRQVHHRH
jgi:hypothetical protein